MITPRQIRAARALLGWSQQQLADKAIVSLNAVTRLEKAKVDSRLSTLVAIEKALTKAGIDFLPAGERGEGVRLKSAKM
jgi:predicted transcriptional regulator